MRIHYYRFKVFEDRMLRKIFRPRREKVAHNWSRLHDEEIYNMYISPNISRGKDGMGRASSMHGKAEKCTQNFGQKT
jgi:hypothetical protein